METIKTNYLCQSWQGFLQQLVYLVSRGYTHYCLIHYPSHKKEKWNRIDLKLIGKYRCNQSKFQRARAKNKGIANFYFIRFNDIALVMHTPGRLPEGLTIDDSFRDCRNKNTRLTIPVKTIELNIMPPGDPNHHAVTVRLSKNSYRDVKAVLERSCKSQRKHLVVREFDRLNGLPAWAGIVRQKKMLAKYTVNQARKNHIPLNADELRINTRRKIYKVWQ